jgi:CheY-like chemotaxis protein
MIHKILLADDDPDDVDLFSEALHEISASVDFNSVSDGNELIESLVSGPVHPHLIFIDINMPDMNGWEALERIKKDVALQGIPVIMYSTTSSQLDGERARGLGALCFYQKPNNFRTLKNFLTRICSSNIERLTDTIKEASKYEEYVIF